jgi:hypothetical protein
VQCSLAGGVNDGRPDKRPAARQHPPPDAGIFDGEVSSWSPLMIERLATREPHIASTSGSVDRAGKRRRWIKEAMPADGTRAAVQTRRGLRHIRALEQLWTKYSVV